MRIFLCTKGDEILISQCGDEYLCSVNGLPEDAEIMFCYNHKEPCFVLWKAWLNYGAKIEETTLAGLRKRGGLFSQAADMAERLAAYDKRS